VNGLTPRQRSIFAYLCAHVRERGYPPTIREIRDAFHLRSNRGVIDHLRALERKGYIRRTRGSPRAIEIEGGWERAGGAGRPPRGGALYPVAGTIRAGRPEPPAGGAARALVLDEALFAERGDFILEVRGDSMVGEHILPGDLIVVRKEESSPTGSLVAVLVDGEATVKRLVRGGGHIVLEPANPAYAPIVLSGDRASGSSIIGRVVGVIRSYPARRKAVSG
jgi:repressor LexA